jgi:hypothetical protein
VMDRDEVAAERGAQRRGLAFEDVGAPFVVGPELDQWTPWAASQRSASRAALQPMPAAVTAWR